MFTERIRNVCEGLDWCVGECGKYVELSQYTPAGEDFSFAVSKENFVADIRDYAFEFDPEEHAEMWVEARKSGVPGVPRLRELLDDADALADMLDNLAEEVRIAELN